MMGSILVIDDEESIRFTFEKYLVREGHNVATAKGYHEAVDSITKKNYDLIISDIMLDGMTGIHVLKTVRERGEECPVVLITGYPHVESAAEAVRLGAFDYIPKPVDLDSLLTVTRKALTYKFTRDEKEKHHSTIETMFGCFKGTMIAADGACSVITLNEGAEQNCGIPQSVIGSPLGSLTTKCNGTCIEVFAKTVTEEKGFETHHLECRRNGFPARMVTMTTYPLLDKQGRYAGGVLLIIDENVTTGTEYKAGARSQFHGMIGKCEAMQKLYALIQTLADVRTSVLLTGESGTGKELAAEALYHAGNRASKPFVKVNCAALHETLLESELFGHVRGAFTGAVQDKIGRFQKADGGTILLDEIGDISQHMQVRLLRVLQEMEFERVGDSTPIKVDVRVIAATNKDLREKVLCGEFREDLFYRLNVIEISLPALRERKEDLPLLIGHFISKLNAKFGKQILAVSDDVLRTFEEYPWPGNVRELEHALEYAFIYCRQSTISSNHLPPAITGRSKAVLPLDLDDERKAVLDALEKTSWNKTMAASLLNMSRRTIYRKIKEYNIAQK